jgi:hypothetical protein
VKTLADDPRRPRAILHRLDPPQDQLGVRLADGESEHVAYIARMSIELAYYLASAALLQEGVST